jgi:tetratricopeptide (TPR) repeat protein
MLLNNLAVALAHQGRTSEAWAAFRKITLGQTTNVDDITFKATEGLLSFRDGNIDEGRRLYREAVTKADADSLPEQMLRAYVYYLLEELNINPAMAISLLPAAEKAFKLVNTAELKTKLRVLQTAAATMNSFDNLTPAST